MSYNDIKVYLKRNLYSENDIYIDFLSTIRVCSGDLPIINGETDQIFKIYKNPLCFKFLNFMYKLYLGCEASKARDKFLPFLDVPDYWNSKTIVNLGFYQFLLKDIFLVIRKDLSTSRTLWNKHATPGQVDNTPGRTGTQGRLSTGSQSSALISNGTPPKLGKLVVKLDRARNLQTQEFLQNPNPYVVFVFGKKRYQSSVKFNNTDPVFDEEFVFEDVLYPTRSSLALSVNYQVIEKNTGEGKRPRNVVLGVFDVSYVMWSKGPQSPRYTWIPISTRKGTYGGELNLSITWLPNN